MDSVTLWTIGHGRHEWEVFLGLLRQYEIALVCDVRSVARSRWAQFNGIALERLLGKAGIAYEHLPECGGKYPVPRADLERGLERIMELASDTSRLALMCSESQPLTKHKQPRANCHRVGLLAPPLKQRGARIIHILPDDATLELDETRIPSVWHPLG